MNKLHKNLMETFSFLIDIGKKMELMKTSYFFREISQEECVNSIKEIKDNLTDLVLRLKSPLKEIPKEDIGEIEDYSISEDENISYIKEKDPNAVNSLLGLKSFGKVVSSIIVPFKEFIEEIEDLEIEDLDIEDIEDILKGEIE